MKKRAAILLLVFSAIIGIVGITGCGSKKIDVNNLVPSGIQFVDRCFIEALPLVGSDYSIDEIADIAPKEFNMERTDDCILSFHNENNKGEFESLSWFFDEDGKLDAIYLSMPSTSHYIIAKIGNDGSLEISYSYTSKAQEQIGYDEFLKIVREDY